MEQPRVLVAITSYNRLTGLVKLCNDLYEQDRTTDIVVFDDHSPEQFKPMAENIRVITSPEHRALAAEIDRLFHIKQNTFS